MELLGLAEWREGKAATACRPSKVGRVPGECQSIEDAGFWTIRSDAVVALTEQKNFSTATLAHAVALVDQQRGNWVLNRVINDRGQFNGALTMLDLHLSSGGAGFALTDLRKEVKRYGFGSPNRVTALAGVLLSGHFLTPIPAADLRLRKLAPTGQFITFYRERVRSQLQAQTLVSPEMRPVIGALAEPSFLANFLHGHLTLYRSGMKETRNDPGLSALAERANALVMLYAIYVAEAHGTSAATSALARDFAVARSHVVSVMKEAEGYGLIVLDGSTRSFRPTALLRRALDLVFATTFLVHAKANEFALKRQILFYPR